MEAFRRIVAKEFNFSCRRFGELRVPSVAVGNEAGSGDVEYGRIREFLEPKMKARVTFSSASLPVPGRSCRYHRTFLGPFDEKALLFSVVYKSMKQPQHRMPFILIQFRCSGEPRDIGSNRARKSSKPAAKVDPVVALRYE
jgi:hypothetical protein